MTVYLDQHGVWRFDFWQGGARHQGQCLDGKGQRVANKTAAKQAQAIERSRVLEGNAAGRRTLRASDYALAQAQDAILTRVVDRRRKAAHVDNVRLYGDDILAWFGPELPFRELTQASIDAYAAHVAAQPVRRWLGGKRRPTAADFKDDSLWKDTGRRRSQRQVNNYLKHLRKLLAIAAKVRDPVTRQPALTQYPELEIELDRVPRRKPRPISDRELEQRLATLTPWMRDAVELARLFGLRKAEALALERRHVDEQVRGLFWRGEEAKSGHDEHAFGGAAGWRLVQRLERQAIARGQQRLVTWPGPQHVHAALEGRKVPADCWRPLRNLSGWAKSASRAGVTDPHRFHDVRARYITAVAQENKAAARHAARHQHSATTDLYIQVGDDEVAQAVAQAMARRHRTTGPRARLRAVK